MLLGLIQIHRELWTRTNEWGSNIHLAQKGISTYCGSSGTVAAVSPRFRICIIRDSESLPDLFTLRIITFIFQ